jgi:hypothetical protein
LPVFLLNLKGDTEIALKQREGSALRYRYLKLFSIPVIPISKSFIADYCQVFFTLYRLTIPCIFCYRIRTTNQKSQLRGLET